MENPLIEKLLKIVYEFLQSEKGNLNGAVHISTNFQKEKLISPDSLLELAYSSASNESYSLGYIFAKASGTLSTENAKNQLLILLQGLLLLSWDVLKKQKNSINLLCKQTPMMQI